MQFHQLKHFAHGERRHAASVQLCPSPLLGRRRFMLGTAAALAVGCLPAEANVPVPYDWNAASPIPISAVPTDRILSASATE